MGNRRLPPRETRQPTDRSRIHTLSFHAPRGRGSSSPHVERGAVLRGSERASADADRQPPRRRDPPRAEGAPERVRDTLATLAAVGDNIRSTTRVVRAVVGSRVLPVASLVAGVRVGANVL